MPQLEQINIIDISPLKFLRACSDTELQEINLLLNNPEFANRIQPQTGQNELPEVIPTYTIQHFVACWNDYRDAELMFNRYTGKFKRDIEAFKNDLCTIDRWKFERYFEGGAK